MSEEVNRKLPAGNTTVGLQLLTLYTDYTAPQRHNAQRYRVYGRTDGQTDRRHYDALAYRTVG